MEGKNWMWLVIGIAATVLVFFLLEIFLNMYLEMLFSPIRGAIGAGFVSSEVAMVSYRRKVVKIIKKAR